MTRQCRHFSDHNFAVHSSQPVVGVFFNAHKRLDMCVYRLVQLSGFCLYCSPVPLTCPVPPCPQQANTENSSKNTCQNSRVLKGAAVWVPQEHDDSACAWPTGLYSARLRRARAGQRDLVPNSKEHFTAEQGGLAGWYCPELWQVYPFTPP